MKNRLLLTAVIVSIFVLPIAVFSSIQGVLTTTMTMDDNNKNGNASTAGTEVSLPQPNDKSTILKAHASNALFESAAGLSNVCGPGGLFPFEDVFTCADALTCGVSAGEGAMFTGTFEKATRTT